MVPLFDPPDVDPPDVPVLEGFDPEVVPLPGLDGLPPDATKGFASWAIDAWLRSTEKAECAPLCCCKSADALFEFSAVPCLEAKIHFELLFSPWSLQLVHLIFAVMAPSAATPLPASSVNPLCVAASLRGSTSPRPTRPEMVTFPLPSAYMTSMVEPPMSEPVPIAAHWKLEGVVMEK